MRGPALHTAEDATRQELRGASLRLLMWLVICVILGPLVRALPLGQTTRTGILAWLLVAMALYWLYAGLGYRPLLLIQRVDAVSPGKTAVHLDIRVENPEAEVARLEALGARVAWRVDETDRGGSSWTTMAAPHGTLFCVLRIREEK